MKTSALLVLPTLAGVLALSACDQPKWRKPAQPVPASTTPAADAPKAPKARVIPAVDGPTPAAPDWAKPVLGKTLRDVYPKTSLCKGNTDIVQQTYSGAPAGVQIHGWGWDLAKKARIERVVLVDKDFKIVGAGAGGVARPDVTQNLPEVTDGNTGWNADAPLTKGAVDAYGVIGADSICPLGHIDF